MHKVVVIFFISAVQVSAYGNAVKITKPKQRGPLQVSGEASLANSSFIGFLKCSGEKNEKDTLRCVRRYFPRESSDAKILRYSEALRIAKEYTELFYCDDGKKMKIEIFEDKNDYDFFLCFQSSIVPNEQKTGIVYFKKSEGMPKISRIQM